MKQLLQLRIATPSRQVVNREDVEIVNAPGSQGDVGILPNHAPLLTKLRDGIIQYRVEGKIYALGVTNAFMDVSDNTVTVISEAAILPEEADQRRAEESRRRAHDQLQKRLEGTDFRMVEAELRRSLLELKLLEHIRR